MAYTATERIPLLHPADAAELRHRVNNGNVVRSALFLGMVAATAALALVVGSSLTDRANTGPRLCSYPVARGDTLAGFADLTGANMRDLRRWNGMGSKATVITELGSLVAPCVPGQDGTPIQPS